VMSNGAKLLRQGNQGPNATTQQVDASTTTSASATTTPDRSNTETNTTQEHGVMDADSSLLSELATQTPWLNQTRQTNSLLC